MKDDNETNKIFAAIMQNCRKERKNKTKSTIRELAKNLDATENYLSAVENGREYPSLRLFLRYLIINNFDLSPLKELKINKTSSLQGTKLQKKAELLNSIYSLNDNQISFMAEQIKVASKIYGKRSKK